MTILDAKGRLFGKVSILDLGAALIIVLVLIGIFVVPGTTGTSATGTGGQSKTVEVDVIVRGLSTRYPEQFFDQFKKEGKTNIIIRNQPHGQINIKSAERTPRLVLAQQPDGRVTAVDDPRPDSYSLDMLVTLEGKAQLTDTGIVVGNDKLKIGTTVELEGQNYNFNASVIDVRLMD